MAPRGLQKNVNLMIFEKSCQIESRLIRPKGNDLTRLVPATPELEITQNTHVEGKAKKA